MKNWVFPKIPWRDFKELVERPHGIILVTGPTGSGKTTTLYCALEKINSPEKKIITVEDPVEYQLRGINQIQVKPAIGLTFANALRSIVRQDPDVILIGEIRDAETAEIAIQSALTGHLVLSTLHTNDAPSAITRLIDMGMEDYLLSSTIIGILAQRLVRVACPHCRVPYTPDPAILREMKLDRRTLRFSNLRGQRDARIVPRRDTGAARESSNFLRSRRRSRGSFWERRIPTSSRRLPGSRG